MATRRERIESMLAEEPGDSFLRYSLALELAKEGRHEQGLYLLRGLMADTPPYIAAFFMAGQQLAGLEKIEDARGVLRSGIEAARAAGDAHAAGEMSEFLTGLGKE